MFLGRDILRGDASWLTTALLDQRVLGPKELSDSPLQLNLYTDATPDSTAAIIQALNTSFAQAFQQPKTINRAEMITAIRGLHRAAQKVRDTHLVLHEDNAATFSSLRNGTGRIFRHHDIRRLYLSMLHGLNHNTFRVGPIAGEAHNPADAPSRNILATLHLRLESGDVCSRQRWHLQSTEERRTSRTSGYVPIVTFLYFYLVKIVLIVMINKIQGGHLSSRGAIPRPLLLPPDFRACGAVPSSRQPGAPGWSG